LKLSHQAAPLLITSKSRLVETSRMFQMKRRNGLGNKAIHEQTRKSAAVGLQRAYLQQNARCRDQMFAYLLHFSAKFFFALFGDLQARGG
jgi:hypothetical protein